MARKAFKITTVYGSCIAVKSVATGMGGWDRCLGS